MSGHGEKLSRKQEAAIAALLGQPTLPLAAQTCGLHEKTLRRWLKLPGFAAAYLEARRRVVQHTIAQSQQVSAQALLVLRAVMLSDKAPASARVTAARSIVELAVKGLETEDILQRIEALEAQNAQRGSVSKLLLLCPSTTTRVHSRWITSARRRLRCERYAAWFLCW